MTSALSAPPGTCAAASLASHSSREMVRSSEAWMREYVCEVWVCGCGRGARGAGGQQQGCRAHCGPLARASPTLAHLAPAHGVLQEGGRKSGALYGGVWVEGETEKERRTTQKRVESRMEKWRSLAFSGLQKKKSRPSRPSSCTFHGGAAMTADDWHCTVKTKSYGIANETSHRKEETGDKEVLGDGKKEKEARAKMRRAFCGKKGVVFVVHTGQKKNTGCAGGTSVPGE